jgi:hypothetical protein
VAALPDTGKVGLAAQLVFWGQNGRFLTMRPTSSWRLACEEAGVLPGEESGG